MFLPWTLVLMCLCIVAPHKCKSINCGQSHRDIITLATEDDLYNEVEGNGY